MQRRRFLTGSLAFVAAGCASLSETDKAEVEKLGTIHHVLGRRGFVVAAPHGMFDEGSLATALEIQQKTGAGGVFARGFSIRNGEFQTRINVNRNSEQTRNYVARGDWLQSYSARAAHINARYVALVREASQGPLDWFFEIHTSPIRPPAIMIATGGISFAEAKQFREFFRVARDRLLPPGAPRIEVLVEPFDSLPMYSYQWSSSISEFSRKGYLIECPYEVMGDRSIWRNSYSDVLSDVIESTVRAS